MAAISSLCYQRQLSLPQGPADIHVKDLVAKVSPADYTLPLANHIMQHWSGHLWSKTGGKTLFNHKGD